MKVKIEEIRETERLFCAIRKGGFGNFVDISSISGSLDYTEHKTFECKRHIPEWDKKNPVVCYAVVHLDIDRLIPK